MDALALLLLGVMIILGAAALCVVIAALVAYWPDDDA